MSIFLRDRDFIPAVGGLIKKSEAGSSSLARYLLVGVLSIAYYLMFHGPANLHDISHYLVSGVAMARDHANFIYPYSSMDPQGGGSAYGYFQENSQLIDLSKSYPSKLYSGLFSLWYLVFGNMRFYVPHLVSLSIIVISNLFLFAIARHFFLGLKQVLFVICVTFTPVVVTAMNPANDTFAYFSSVLVLWCCFCTRLSPLSIGLIVGSFSHFRSQIIFFVFILPILFIWLSDRKSALKVGIESVVGVLTSYIVIGMLLKLPITAEEVSGGGLDFYIKFFLASFYGPSDVAIIAEQFVRNLVNLGDKNYLYIFLFTGVLTLFVKENVLPKTLAFSALLLVSFPLCIYSLDRYSPPHTRYYVGAIPFLVLSWFLLLESCKSVKSNLMSAVTALFLLTAWYNVNGFPLKNIASVDVIKSRVDFLDFPGAEKALAEQFDDSDLLITNHALPSGLSNLKSFIPYPAFSEFKQGDNKEINGLVFVYADKGTNDFFRPVDWLVNGALPDVIKDNSGVSFKKVFTQTSNLNSSSDHAEDEAKFVLYKNTNPLKGKEFDGQGRRIYSVRYHDELNVLVTQSPNFTPPTLWSGKISSAGERAGVIVGPGYNNANVLSQSFSVKGSEMLKVQALVSSAGNKFANGRLQINWADDKNGFLGASISVFKASSEPHIYSKVFLAPSTASQGVVYVTPHDDESILNFKSMEVLRAPQDE